MANFIAICVNPNQKSTQCNLYINNIFKKRSITTQTTEKKKSVYIQTLKPRTSKYDVENFDFRLRVTVCDAYVQTEKDNIVKSDTDMEDSSNYRINTFIKTEVKENEDIDRSDMELDMDSSSDSRINAFIKTEIKTTEEIGIQTELDVLNESMETVQVFQLFPCELGKSIWEIVTLFESLSCAEKISSDKKPSLEITRKGLFVELYSSDSCKYILSNTGVMKLCSIFKGVLSEQSVVIDGEFQIELATELLHNFASEKFVFCQGLSCHVKDILAELPTKPNQLVIFKYPAEHLISFKCEGFFKKAGNVKNNVCKNCNMLHRYLRVCQKRSKRRASVVLSQVRKTKANPFSTMPNQYLSPYSVIKKKRPKT